MSISRNSRLSEEMKKIISSIIQTDLKDPRIPFLTSIMDVQITKDLRYAKVFVSVYGDEDQKAKCIEGLKSASGYIRKELGSKIKIRYVPELIFQIDNSIEYGIHISKVLREVNKEQ